MVSRAEEICQLLRMSPDEVRELAGERLVVCADLDSLHRRMADDIADEIQANNRADQPTRLILPVGPTGQYEYLVERIHRDHISLADCWIFFMDEYCTEFGKVFDASHPLSFRWIAEDLFLGKLSNEVGLNRAQVFFPNEENVDTLAQTIADVGGIDTCYGGIGIHGHVAFNEPEAGVKFSTVRKVRLNDFTVTINAIRAQVGGNLEGFPRYAYTLGMKEILSSRKIRLYCRNGTDFDWANTVLRLALLGQPGDDYPVTHIRDLDYTIVTDGDTLNSPKYIL